jgi:multidrug resistance efflux pump
MSEGTKLEPETALGNVSAFLIGTADPGQQVPLPLDAQDVLVLVAAVGENGRFLPALQSVLMSLAARLSCDRVSWATVHHGITRIIAISGNAHFNEKTDIVQAIREAMEEAVDQGRTVVWPAGSYKQGTVNRSHEGLAERSGSGANCSFCVHADGRIVGAVTFERPQRTAFDDDTVSSLEAMAAVLGPVLELKRLEDRSWLAKSRASLRRSLEHLFGAGHLSLKLSAIAVLLLGAVLVGATGDFRVTAAAKVEGEVLQSAVAPFDGYLDQALVRAGDMVEEGQLLAALQDKDLNLDRLKWVSQQEELLKEYRQALAERDAAKGEIVSAKLQQVEAELGLATRRLQRAQITSPFAGVVVSGDFSQKLGSPLEEGRLLFEIAPLNSYRIILRVDDRDISWVAVGQHGQLRLSALPHQVFPYTITRIMPVSEAKDGVNVFRVEASVDGHAPVLRPAMEGIGKIHIGEGRLVWIWTHDIVDWLRVKLWAWLP